MAALRPQSMMAGWLLPPSRNPSTESSTPWSTVTTDTEWRCSVSATCPPRRPRSVSCRSPSCHQGRKICIVEGKRDPMHITIYPIISPIAAFSIVFSLWDQGISLSHSVTENRPSDTSSLSVRAVAGCRFSTAPLLERALARARAACRAHVCVRESRSRRGMHKVMRRAAAAASRPVYSCHLCDAPITEDERAARTQRMDGGGWSRADHAP